MSWNLSRFRAGDLVEVRSREEILATLDQHGCLDRMPFMPEMLQYCGGRFRVGAVAHKTCDTLRKTGGRRLSQTVHLDGVRCDGSAHGGCQADCLIFWKDAWLKPVAEDRPDSRRSTSHEPAMASRGCTAEELLGATRLGGDAGADGPRYSCQATRLHEASEPLAPWDVRQYALDVLTRNHSMGRVARVVSLAWCRFALRRTPLGYRIVRRLSEFMHRALTGRRMPALDGKVPRGKSTPTVQLDLMPGEYVRIKSQSQIEQTLDEHGRNRGLSFDAEEMAPFCGRVCRVKRRVTQIIDEPTGRLIPMKHPCVILEGVVCMAEYARCRLNCPRAIPSYWREAWLERVLHPQAVGAGGGGGRELAAPVAAPTAFKGQPSS